MKRETVFIDVGGHRGETLAAVLDPVWLFDRIICFEPQAEAAEHLHKKFACGRVQIIPAALSDANTQTELFGSGVGASLFHNKRGVNTAQKQSITTVSAADFFRDNIGDDAMVIMKLNCEGGEGAVLRDLATSGQLSKLHYVMIDFDLRKIPGMKSEPGKILKLLADKNFHNYCLAENVLIGSPAAALRNWLSRVPDIKCFCASPADVIKDRKATPIIKRIRCFRRYHPAFAGVRWLADAWAKFRIKPQANRANTQEKQL